MKRMYEFFYRNLLPNTKCKQYYDSIYTSVFERENSFKIVAEPEAEKNISQAMEAVLRDWPEYDCFLTGQVRVKNQEQVPGKLLVQLDWDEPWGQTELQKELKKITRKAKGCKSSFLKMAKIYSLIAERFPVCPSYDSSSHSFINSIRYRIGENQSFCRLLVVSLRSIGLDCGIMYHGEKECYVMVHLETGNYKLDFTKRSSLLELLPEKEKTYAWFLSLQLEEGLQELHFLSNDGFRKMAECMYATEEGQKFLHAYYEQYGCAYERLSWEFLECVAEVESPKKQEIETMAISLYIRSFNEANQQDDRNLTDRAIDKSTYFYLRIMKKLNPGTSSRVLLNKAKTYYYEKSAPGRDIFQNLLMDKYCKEDVQEIAKEYEEELPVEILNALASEYGYQLLCDGEQRELLIELYNHECNYRFLFEDVWTDIQCRFFCRYFTEEILKDDYEMFSFVRYFALLKEAPYDTLEGYALFMNRLALAEQLLKEYGINMSMYLFSTSAGEIDLLADLLLFRKEHTEELFQKGKSRYLQLEWISGKTQIRHAENLNELIKGLELDRENGGYDKKKTLEEIILGRKQLLLIYKDEELYATLLVVKGTVEEIRKKKHKNEEIDETIWQYIQDKCLALSGRYFYSLNEKIPPVYES